MYWLTGFKCGGRIKRRGSRQRKIIINLIIKRGSMSYSFPFGQAPEGYPFYPPQPPAPPLPWNFPSLGFQPPIHPNYPQQTAPFYSLPPTSSLFLNQQYSNFYALDPSGYTFDSAIYSNPSFQKLMHLPKPPAKEASVRNTRQPQRSAAEKQREAEVIQISDDECEHKRVASKRRKGSVSREQRVFVELKRLSNKRFVKLAGKDREDLQNQLKSMAEKMGAEAKRSKRAAEHLSRQYRESKSFIEFEESPETRKTSKRKTHECKSNEQAYGVFNSLQLETNIPRILKKQQLRQQKRSLKQALLLRSLQNL